MLAIIKDGSPRSATEWLESKLNTLGLSSSYLFSNGQLPDQECYDDTVDIKEPETKLARSIKDVTQIEFAATANAHMACSEEFDQAGNLYNPTPYDEHQVNSEVKFDVDELQKKAQNKTIIFIAFHNQYFDETIKENW